MLRLVGGCVLRNYDLLVKRLKKRFPESVFDGPSDPFRVLIFTIISQRTKDEQTRVAGERLLSKFPSVNELAKAATEDIEALIKPAGFYRVKAKKIKEVCRILQKEHGGQVPDDIDQLLALPSVGRKTANCVLLFGYGKHAIPVDTHVHRISNRLGLVSTTSPEETEKALINVLPQRYWRDINHIFVRFGQTICRPVAPRCKKCPVNNLCEWFKEAG